MNATEWFKIPFGAAPSSDVGGGVVRESLFPLESPDLETSNG